MATFTSPRLASGKHTQSVHAGMNSVIGSFSAGGVAVSAGDVVQMVRIPAGATIHSVRYSGGLCEGSTCIVGDGGVTNRYAATASASSISLVTDCMALEGHGYTYTADDTIDITYDAAASPTALGVVTLEVTYSMANPKAT